MDESIEQAWLAAAAAVMEDDEGALAAALSSTPRLLSHRGEIGNQRPKSKGSLLMLATHLDKERCVVLLASHGLDIHEAWESPSAFFNGKTPLSLAIMCAGDAPREAMVGALMASDKKSAANREAWQLAMSIASERDLWSIARDIYAHLGLEGEHFWPEIRDEFDSSLWHVAASNGSREGLAMLWEWHGMSVLAELPNAHGRAPVEEAKLYGKDAFASELAQRIAVNREALALSAHVGKRPRAQRKSRL